jgi:hypothetical protein
VGDLFDGPATDSGQDDLRGVVADVYPCHYHLADGA